MSRSVVGCGGQGKTLAACLQDVARPQGRREGLCVPGSMSMGVSSLNRLFLTELYCLSWFIDVSESQGPGATLQSFSFNCSPYIPTLELLHVQPPTTFFNPPSLTRWQGTYVGKVGSWAQLGTVGEGQTLNSQSQRWCESDGVSHSVMSDSATLWTVACQAPLVHGILQARILEWVAIPFSKDLPDPGIEPGLLHCRQILYHLSHQGSP